MISRPKQKSCSIEEESLMNIAKSYGMSYEKAQDLKDSFIIIHTLAEEKKSFAEWYGYNLSD